MPHFQEKCTVAGNLQDRADAFLAAIARRDPGRSRVNPDGILDGPAVAACDSKDDREPDLAGLFEHDGVAARETLESERQTPQPIAFVRVGAGEVETRSARDAARTPGRRSRQTFEVFVVARAVVQLDVEEPATLWNG